MGFTSPPYLGQRDYGSGFWQGGDPDCQHQFGNQRKDTKAVYENLTAVRPGSDHSRCKKCGAERIDQQIGLETTVDEYVEALVTVFREFRRALAEHGTLWLNLGDSYASAWASGRRHVMNGGSRTKRRENISGSLKERDLIGIPWRVALAMQADGWWLRSEIIWAKRNNMPESVRDRPSQSHEKVFMFAKTDKKLFWLNPERARATNKKPKADYYYTRQESGERAESAPEHWKAEGWKRQNRWASLTYWYDSYVGREENSSPKQLAHNLKYAKPYDAYDSRVAKTGQPGNVNNVGIHSRPGQKGRNMRNVWSSDDPAAWHAFFRVVAETVGKEEAHALAAQIWGEETATDLWWIASEPFREAHFATFPTKLVEKGLLPGCPERVCSSCSQPYVRLVGREQLDTPDPDIEPYDAKSNTQDSQFSQRRLGRNMKAARDAGGAHDNPFAGYIDLGLHPVCECDAAHRPGRVLDMFSGAATVAVTAERHGRDWAACDLSEEFNVIGNGRLERLRFAREQVDPFADTVVFDEEGEEAGFEQLAIKFPDGD